MSRVIRNPYSTKPVRAPSEEEDKKIDSSTSSKPAATADDDGPITNSESASALVIAAADKAGMEGIDRSKIDAIILRESGSSLYMQKQRQRDQQVDERIRLLRARLEAENAKHPSWKTKLQNTVDQEIPDLIGQRPIRSTCVVVDMDMFFMACELLSRPDLVDKPACVGGSMITTSNYVARRYGVRSAMAGWIGDRLVEELSGGKEKLIHVKSNFDLYKEKSAVVRSVLAEYDPHLRAYSLDEAFMDMAPYLQLKMTKTNWTHEQIRDELFKRDANKSEVVEKEKSESHPEWSESLTALTSFTTAECMRQASDVIANMRERVCRATGGLTCSAGLAPNFLLAKIASDRNKPNGQCLVDSDHESVKKFLYPLPIRKVPGIGRVSEKTLQAFSIHSVGDLYNERGLVQFLFKPATAGFLKRASVGCSSSDRTSDEDDNGSGQKGISRERTFQSGQSWSDINSKLEDIARLLASDMGRKGIWARTITLKVKLHTFDVYSRARSMPFGVYVHKADELANHAAEILREIKGELKGNPFNVRLLGIRCSNFRGDENGHGQTSLEKFLEPKHSPTKTAGIKSFSKKEGNSPMKKIDTPEDTKSDACSDSPGSVVMHACPVCQKKFPEHKNIELNQHVDMCLSGRVVRSVLREQMHLSVVDCKKKAGARAGQKRKITDFW